jgi:hypothetical protein
VRAPYAERIAPRGLYELRLFRCPDACNVLLGSLPVQVSARAPGALVLGRGAFRLAKTIEVTVTLPTNRYYFGQWFGPLVQLVPLGPDGRDAPRDQLARWAAQCSDGCGAWFPEEAFDASLGPNPYDGGRSIRTVDAAGQPRKYTVRLVAPSTAGRYAVRLFDRGRHRSRARAPGRRCRIGLLPFVVEVRGTLRRGVDRSTQQESTQQD